MAVILPTEENQAPEVIDKASLIALNGPLPRVAAELAAVVEAEVTLRLLRRFAASRGWSEEVEAALRWELAHAQHSELEAPERHRSSAIGRTVEDLAAFATLHGAITVDPNDSGHTLQGGPLLVWSTVCVVPRLTGPLSNDSLQAARAYLDELRKIRDEVPLSQRTLPFRSPRSTLPADLLITSEGLRANNPAAFDGGTPDERGFWMPRLSEAPVGQRFIDAAWGAGPCLVEVLGRCPVDGCTVAQTKPILDRAAFERGARFAAPGMLRRALWWSAPVAFAPEIAAAARSLNRGGGHGVGLPRPEAVRALLRARAFPNEPVWSVTTDGGTETFSGGELVRDFDEAAPHDCFSGLSLEACEEEALQGVLQRSRELTALRSLARGKGVPDRDVRLAAQSTSAGVKRLREALVARLFRPNPPAAQVARLRAEFGRMPRMCEQFRRVAVLHDGAPPGCSVEALRAAEVPAQLAADCDSLAVPEFGWWCVAGQDLGTHFSTVASCPSTAGRGGVLGSDWTVPLEASELVTITLQTIRNCDDGLRRHVLANEADVRALQRGLHNERLVPAWKGLAAEKLAAAELDHLVLQQMRQVRAGTADIATAANTGPKR